MTAATVATPYVMVHSAKEFVDFVSYVFGAQVVEVVPLEGDPERVVHGEMRIGESTIFYADARIDGEQCLPPYRKGDDPRPTQMWVSVAEPKRTYDAGVEKGASVIVPFEDQGDGSAQGGWIDPFGTIWWISSDPLRSELRSETRPA